jgi:carbamate kinase
LRQKQRIETKSTMVKKKVVIAIGGNAILENGQSGSFEEQFKNVTRTARKIVTIVRNANDFEIAALTHGNGPQVGIISVQQDMAASKFPRQPMHALIAMTQGQLGYMFQQALQNELMKAGISKPVISIVTQTLVHKDDPEFSKVIPSKPIGPLYTHKEAKDLAELGQYTITQVKPAGERIWRRVVPSPVPREIVESDIVMKLADFGCMVIASGGGGVPVIQNGHGYCGVDGVVDKDLIAGILGKAIGASVLLILTDIDKVRLNFGKPNEIAISQMSLHEAIQHYRDGQFLDGSMGPKIKSSIEFLESGGELAIITTIDNAVDALYGKAGTRIVKSIDQASPKRSNNKHHSS